MENVYKLYKNFKWKKSKTKVYKKTYVAKYKIKIGNKYLALYTKSGKFVGYINTGLCQITGGCLCKRLVIMIAALITAMEGTTILPLSHHVKADTNTVLQTSQAENDLTKYKKINGIGDNTVLGAIFPIINCKKMSGKKSGKITKNRSFQCV